MHDKDSDHKNIDQNPLFLWPLIGAMLGCDYIKRTCNYAFVTLFNKTFPQLVTWDVNDAIDQLHQRTKFVMNPEHKKTNRSYQFVNLCSCDEQ